MSIRRVGVFNSHTELRNSAVPSFSSGENSQTEKSECDKNINKVVSASVSIGVTLSAAWLYLKAKGPELLKKFLKRFK